MDIYEREDVESEEDLAALTIDELKARRDGLVADIQSIEGQLTQKDRRDSGTGDRLSDRDFHEWRGRAVTARKHLLTELREVKTEIAKTESNGYAAKKQAEWELLERIEAKLDLLLRHFDV